MTPERRGPDFLGIGAQRSGTTWLHRNLTRHKDIWLFPAPLKEVHFFDELHVEGHEGRHVKRTIKLQKLAIRLEKLGRATPEILSTLDYLQKADRDDAWYHRLFEIAPQGKLLGEVTPAYSLLPRVGIDHMLRINPEIRLLLLLRHPVERAWSHVRHTIDIETKYATDLDTVDVSANRVRVLAMSDANRQRTDYPGIIKRYLGLVPQEQLYISFFDRVLSEPLRLLADVAEFLGVDPAGFDGVRLPTRKRHNSASDLSLPPALARELAATYRGDVLWLMDNVQGLPETWLGRLEAHATAR